MSARVAWWLAWSLCGLCVALLAAGGVLFFLNGAIAQWTGTWGTVNMNFILPVVNLSFTLVGALISSRLPGNPIGWIFLAIGLALMLAGAAADYYVYAIETRPGSLPGGEYMAWLQNWLWGPR